MNSTDKRLVHPFPVRAFHWINAAALLVMVMSGWRIYNASPLFPFTFPKVITLGNWLGGALQLHFSAMWLLLANLAAYLLYGIFSGRFRGMMFPLAPRAALLDLRAALALRLGHSAGSYNSLQRLAYVGVFLAILATMASGLAIWKPVQVHGLTALMGGYEAARRVHFLGMAIICLFAVGHVALALLFPSAILAMITGKARGP